MAKKRSTPSSDVAQPSPDFRARIHDRLQALEETLAAAVDMDSESPDDWLGQLVVTTSELRKEVVLEQLRKDAAVADGAVVVSTRDVISRALKTLREASGLTQEGLAEKMRESGFEGWKRITVAEIEGKKRWASLEELMVLASLFGCAVGDLLSGLQDGEALAVNETLRATRRQVEYAFAGRRFNPDEVRNGIRLTGPKEGDPVLRDSVLPERFRGSVAFNSDLWAD